MFCLKGESIINIRFNFTWPSGSHQFFVRASSHRPVFWTFLLGTLLFSVAFPRISSSDLAEVVTIPVLNQNQDQYDGKVISVEGFSNGGRWYSGRRGSRFQVMNLGDPECFCYVDVVLPPEKGLTPVQFGRRVIGTYHKEGKFGGIPFKHFIIADEIF